MMSLRRCYLPRNTLKVNSFRTALVYGSAINHTAMSFRVVFRTRAGVAIDVIQAGATVLTGIAGTFKDIS